MLKEHKERVWKARLFITGVQAFEDTPILQTLHLYVDVFKSNTSLF